MLTPNHEHHLRVVLQADEATDDVTADALEGA